MMRRRRTNQAFGGRAGVSAVAFCVQLACTRQDPPAAVAHAFSFDANIGGIFQNTRFEGGHILATRIHSDKKPIYHRDLVILNKGHIKKGGGPSPSSDAVTSAYAPIQSHDVESDTNIEHQESLASTTINISDDDSDLLLDILSPRADRDAEQIGPTQLAYVGDILYELFVRCRYIWPSRRMTDLQSTVVDTVRAETQSKLLASMMRSFPFTAKEQSILSRGRNASTGSRGRKRGKEWGAIYQDSTAFEALLGYIYMTDTQRCFEILNWIRNEQDKIDEENGIHVSAKTKESASYNSLVDLLQPRSDCNIDQIAPAQLAYIGDSVYELLARNRYVWPHRRTADLHTKVVSVSRAETQSRICKALTDDGSRQIELTAKESSVLLRGRNAAGGSSGRNKQVKKAARKQDGGAGAAMHQDAAALEALLAYNFIADTKRCHELLQWVSSELDVIDIE